MHHVLPVVDLCGVSHSWLTSTVLASTVLASTVSDSTVSTNNCGFVAAFQMLLIQAEASKVSEGFRQLIS